MYAAYPLLTLLTFTLNISSHQPWSASHFLAFENAILALNNVTHLLNKAWCTNLIFMRLIPPIVWHKNVNFIDTCRVINSWGGSKLLIVCDLTQQLSQCFSCSGFGVRVNVQRWMFTSYRQPHAIFFTITSYSACRSVAFIFTASFKRRLTLIALGAWHLSLRLWYYRTPQ